MGQTKWRQEGGECNQGDVFDGVDVRLSANLWVKCLVSIQTFATTYLELVEFDKYSLVLNMPEFIKTFIYCASVIPNT